MPKAVLVKPDLFHNATPGAIAAAFAAMAPDLSHTFMVITKRPDRMAELLPRLPELSQTLRVWVSGGGAWPLPNVWLGVIVEDQRRAEERIPLLMETPAAMRFVFCEPLLGPVRLAQAAPCPDCDGAGLAGSSADGREIACETCGGHEDAPGSGIDQRLDLVIVGPSARSMHPDWVQSIRDQCVAAGVKFLKHGL